MAEALLIVSHPGADPRWPLTRVAGLPAVERNLMALRSVGATRVLVACGAPEREVLERHFRDRAPDARLPRVTLASLEDRPGREPAVVAIDGSRVYHPAWLRQRLQGPERAALPPDCYSEEIITGQGRRRARRAIRRSLRKPTDGWFARNVDRSVSLAISSVLAPFPVHPNVVTIGTLVVGIVSGVLAARGTYRAWVEAAALFLLASVLDGVDGELSRMKFQGSLLGQWLDTICDDLTNAVYLAGLTAGTWRAFASPWLLWSGIAAVVLDVVTVVFLYWQLVTRLNATTLLAFEEVALAPALRQRGLAGFVARLQPFVKRDVYAPLFLVFALGGAAWLALPGTAVALTVTLLFMLRDFARARDAASAASA